jgi:GH15 family glucan-1,4-alpha-glucosidase
MGVDRTLPDGTLTESVIVVPFVQRNGDNYWANGDYLRARIAVERILNEAPLVFQNGAFDTKVLLHNGWLKYREVEYIKPLYRSLVLPAADFVVRYRDVIARLPEPSYDIWEERWGVHSFTVCAVIAALRAAGSFAESFGDHELAARYQGAARRMRDALERYLFCPEAGRFARCAVPTGDPAKPYELDMTVDASLYALFYFGIFSPDDAKTANTMQAVREKLWVQTPVGGMARYENDPYHRVSKDTKQVPGNPWFICTLWLAQWEIAKAKTMEDLSKAVEVLEWVADHSMPSGILAEQIDPDTHEPRSVSPLTWSHATFVSTVLEYLEKAAQLKACPTCGQPMPAGSRR